MLNHSICRFTDLVNLLVSCGSSSSRVVHHLAISNGSVADCCIIETSFCDVAFLVSSQHQLHCVTETIAQQLGHASLTKTLKWWGSNCTTMKDLVAENRAQFPLKENKALEQAQATLCSLKLHCVDISDVSASFTMSAWYTA